MLKRKGIFFLVLFIAISVLGYTGCSSRTTTTPPPKTGTTSIPKTETTSADGFTFSATVDNVKPRLGDNVNISIVLKNVSNTGLKITDLGGQTKVFVTNEKGQTVYGIADLRPETTLTTSPVPIGWQFDFNPTWTVKTDSSNNISVVAGKYFIDISDTGIHDPVSKQNVTFSLEPIEVDVTN